MEPGDLVQLSCKAGYGYAYHPLIRDAPPKPAVIVSEGTLLLYLGRDDVQTDIRMQPMVRVLRGETLLSIDERFLELVPPSDGMV
jgi:hypothetical protein